MDTLIVRMTLQNTDFLHNNFELIDGRLWWRKRTLTGKNLGRCAGTQITTDTIQLRGITLPVADIISALEF